jgi:DNA (cytosine-5)-methyltransferase 1
MTRIGSLFSGAGALDLAAEQVFDGRTVWHSEIEPAANKALAHHWPDAPNLGDINGIDWTTVEPVDVLCGGFPCQDVSTAASSRRQGMKPGNRSGLWAFMAHAIEVLSPATVVIENVRGLLSAPANRNMEPADAELGPLRAAGAVLGGLADLGFSSWWTTTSAASVGAPHGRERVFILARRDGSTRPPVKPCPSPQLDTERLVLLPTPSASDVTGGSCDPAVRVQQNHHLQLIDVVRMYGTPGWDAYTPAIQRWEALTRPAPCPARTSSAGNPNLSAAFAEWMMGWPQGWISNVPSEQDALFGDPEPALTRSDQLKLCGNGVVPQQAAVAISALLEYEVA